MRRARPQCRPQVVAAMTDGETQATLREVTDAMQRVGARLKVQFDR